MIDKGQIPSYNITDDILNAVAEIVEKTGQLPTKKAMKGRNRNGGEGLKEALPGEHPSPLYRQKGTGVFLGDHLLGRAPMPQCLEERMMQLRSWVEQSSAHPLLKAGIVIYQYVMMQFFEGDNIVYGTQHAKEILVAWKGQMKAIDLAEALQPEGLIRAFEQCDLYGEATPLLLYFLRSVLCALEEVLVAQETVSTPIYVPEADDRVQRLLTVMERGEYTNRELMEMVGLKHRPTFRDKYLLPAMALGLVEMTIPDKPNSSQQRYRKRDLAE